MSILRFLLSSGIDVNAQYPVDIDDFSSGRIRVELSETYLLQEAALLGEDEAVEVSYCLNIVRRSTLFLLHMAPH